MSLLFKIITFLGDSKFIILLTLLLGGYLLFYKKDKYTGILVFVNTINTAILNQGIKYMALLCLRYAFAMSSLQVRYTSVTEPFQIRSLE